MRCNHRRPCCANHEHLHVAQGTESEEVACNGTRERGYRRGSTNSLGEKRGPGTRAFYLCKSQSQAIAARRELVK